MIEAKLLSYDFDALKPILSSDTLYFHHDKHYLGYVEKANELLPGKWNHKTVSEIIEKSRNNGNVALFNQVAQVWNHEFYFNGLSLNVDDQHISEDVMFYIRKDYHNLDNLKSELLKAALSRFGSGWIWLVLENDHLKIHTTLNADTPCGLAEFKPLWTLDVWEHAYYLDYQNRRADYVKEILENAINWHFVDQNLHI